MAESQTTNSTTPNGVQMAEPLAYEMLEGYASARRAVLTNTQRGITIRQEELKVYDWAMAQLKVCTLDVVQRNLEGEKKALQQRLADPKQKPFWQRWQERITGINNTLVVFRHLSYHL